MAWIDMFADPNALIVLITLSIIFIVFLIFDVFKRGEKWSLLAYILALPISNYLWFKGTETTIIYNDISSFGVLGMYFILIILWIVVLLRDAVYVIKGKKDIDDVLLFLLIALLIQAVLTAILPNITPLMQQGCEEDLLFHYFYFPKIYDNLATGAVTAVLNPNTILAYRISVTSLIMLICILLIFDIRDQKLNVLAAIVLTAVFILPFVILGYVWYPPSTAVLTFLFCVILFVALLLISKKD